MGHLFTAGSTTVEGDGVRDVYVGSLACTGREIFPACLDYVALGHLHVPQKVAGEETIRYCGSPLPMGFGEARQQKIVLEIEWSGSSAHVSEIAVPCFQPLRRITGSLEEIQSAIAQAKDRQSTDWLEIEYTGVQIVGNLREIIDESVEGSAMEIRRIQNRRLVERVLNSMPENETLDDLDVEDVFVRCLETYEVAPEERAELIRSHNEILTSLHEEDSNAE
jgi:exonuclease SbcD